MTDDKVTSIRLSANTQRQISDLQNHGYSNIREIIAIAIDRLHKSAIPEKGDAAMNVAYVTGRLFAALVLHDAMQATDFQGNLNVLTNGISRMRTEVIAPIMEVIPANALAGKLSAEEESDFWLGYYHQRSDWQKYRAISPKRLPAIQEANHDN